MKSLVFGLPIGLIAMWCFAAKRPEIIGVLGFPASLILTMVSVGILRGRLQRTNALEEGMKFAIGYFAGAATGLSLAGPGNLFPLTFVVFLGVNGLAGVAIFLWRGGDLWGGEQR